MNWLKDLTGDQELERLGDLLFECGWNVYSSSFVLSSNLISLKVHFDRFQIFFVAQEGNESLLNFYQDF